MDINLKYLSLYIMAGSYLFAGVNHFVMPQFYIPLIPDYLPHPQLLNTLSGIFEIVFGLGLIFRRSRRASSILIVMMLLAFIPSHVYFIELGSCVDQSLCVPEWVSWVRLILVHPLLIWWAWSVRVPLRS